MPASPHVCGSASLAVDHRRHPRGTWTQAAVIVHLADIAVKAISHAELLLGGRLPGLDDFLESSLYSTVEEAQLG